MTARIASVGSLACAVLLVVLVLFNGGDPYRLRADFQDSGGLVVGDEVLVGAAKVGSITSVRLTDSGQAEIGMQLDGSGAPMHAGTVARIYQNSLSGIANRYVSLEPGPREGAPIRDGGLIASDHTFASVNLDQLFDTFDPLTRAGLRGFVRGQAASIQNRAAAANQTLRYLAPGLASTSNLTAELARDTPAFDGLVVQGARAMAALASRRQQLADLIANANATAAAIANQSQALRQALVLLPGTLTRGTATFAGVRSTLDALDPLVARSLPATRRLAPFSASFHSLATVATPTVAQLSTLIHDPSGAGDLTTLALQTPALARLTAVAFPRAIREMNSSQAQLDYLREFTPDVVAALSNLGQVTAYYDASGHYARTQPDFFPFSLNPSTNVLSATPAFDRLTGVQVVHGRCPGGAMQPPPDGSAPVAVPGCRSSSTPPGP
jgi:phospholipid/cholesterol/gamma-HCH transport system substrate-binding protein